MASGRDPGKGSLCDLEREHASQLIFEVLMCGNSFFRALRFGCPADLLRVLMSVDAAVLATMLGD